MGEDPPDQNVFALDNKCLKLQTGQNSGAFIDGTEEDFVEIHPPIKWVEKPTSTTACI